MRRNKKSRSDIIIDVTSLLDVVFIILLIVITQISGSRTSVEVREAQAEEAMREAETQQKLYSDQRDSMEDMDQYIEFISVVSTYDPDTLIDRTITVLSSSDDATEHFELKGEAVDEAYEQFTGYLEDHIKSNPDRIVVLSLNENDEDILYRDERRIESIFTDLSAANPSIRVKTAAGGEV